jgi:zinc-ribbon domain
MYCPRCAAQNLDDAKFCRACGTNLESVALALADKYQPARASVDEDRRATAEERWLEKRSEGTGSIVKGVGLLGASLLIGVALGLFSNQSDWIIIWVGLAGWMACWGFISLTSGIHALMESRFMARLMKQKAAGAAIEAATVNDARMLPDGLTTNKLSIPPSVTEHTTELLSNQPPTSKQTS